MLTFLFWGIGLYVVYWAIRLAVWHALRDAEPPATVTNEPRPKPSQV
jgi:hypothetical protein